MWPGGGAGGIGGGCSFSICDVADNIKISLPPEIFFCRGGPGHLRLPWAAAKLQA